MEIFLVLFLLYFISTFSFLLMFSLTTEQDDSVCIAVFWSLLYSIAAPIVALFIVVPLIVAFIAVRCFGSIFTKGDCNA
jgi:hypothetical protein